MAPILAISLALALAPGRAAAAAHADETPSWSVSGFGTLGVVHSSERLADYTSNAIKHSGAGASQRWSPDVDSRLGMQLDLQIDKRWSAVVQVVSEQGPDNSYRPRIEWANVKYQLTPELALRLGRVALPLFLTADYRRVGYAYPWVRPPVEGYGVVPVTSSDGVDATLRWNAGRLRHTAQVFYGHDDVPLAPPMRARARGIAGISHTAEWGAWSVRANLLRAEVSSDLAAPLFRGLDAFGAAGRAISGRYEMDHKDMRVANVGVDYDPGAWFLMAEAGRTRTDSFLGSTRSAYVSAGWRHGSWTPYATWARVRAAGLAAETGLPLDALPAQAVPAAAALNAGLAALLASIPQQSTHGVGVRWDLHANAALKLQYDRVTPRAGSRGTMINPAPGFRSGRMAHVASVALDFVY
ncbi:porin [uncultured Massilia sp.]|uniref:porin n=1 Tax=uncultured Massilia sp. TaxID=169973 RepID=UPI0025E8BCAD|nr:porin [uncultured Massilia sp.]